MSDSDWCTGLVECENCGSEHIAVWPTAVERQECPACGHMTQSPPTEDEMNDIITENEPQFGEPWRLTDDCDILDKDGNTILGGCMIDESFTYPAPEVKERIVECVNTCSETKARDLEILRTQALTINCVKSIQNKMGLLGRFPPSSKDLEYYLKLTWGVDVKVVAPWEQKEQNT